MTDQNMYRSRNSLQFSSISQSLGWQSVMQGSTFSGQTRQYYGKCYSLYWQIHINTWLWLIVISNTCFSSSHLIPSTPNMFAYLQLMIQSHPNSIRTPNFGHILKTCLVHWKLTSWKWTYFLSKPQRFPLTELPVWMFIQLSICHCLYQVGGVGDRCKSIWECSIRWSGYPWG